MSYSKQELLTLREHLTSSLRFSGGVHVAHFFVCCPIMRLYVLRSVLWCPLRFQHKNYVRFVFTSSCLYEGIFTLFVFACVYWCPTHVVLCLCSVFLRLVCPLFPVSRDFPLLIAPSVFSNVYYLKMLTTTWSGVEINVLSWSVLDRWFELQESHTKDKNMMFAASPLSTQN